MKRHGLAWLGLHASNLFIAVFVFVHLWWMGTAETVSPAGFLATLSGSWLVWALWVVAVPVVAFRVFYGAYDAFLDADPGKSARQVASVGLGVAAALFTFLGLISLLGVQA